MKKTCEFCGIVNINHMCPHDTNIVKEEKLCKFCRESLVARKKQGWCSEKGVCGICINSKIKV